MSVLPPYLTSLAVWVALWPIPVTAILTATILTLLNWPKFEKRFYFTALVSFSLLGLITGFMSGLSRVPAMDAVVPAILSFFAGLAIYLIGVKQADQNLVGVCTIALSLNLITGVMWGATMRDINDRKYEDIEYRKEKAFGDAKLEMEILRFRKALGLPDSPSIVFQRKELESK